MLLAQLTDIFSEGVIEVDYIKYEDTHCQSNIVAIKPPVSSHQECKDLCSENSDCIAAEVITCLLDDY